MAKIRDRILAATRQRMRAVDSPNQVLGRTQTIGCVAVEITQKCNLDCTLCYLSESSESVQDLPIEEIFRRLDQVLEHYGIGTHVQITGGDPTLRKHTELVKIIAYASGLGLYPALFTNGIGAGRKLLVKLSQAGLTDIAFHVDTTQQREGFKTEESLNQIRDEYIDRTRGLGLMVMFNTTVHSDNYLELSSLIEYFVSRAEQIGLVSFNLQAETGRGEWGQRDGLISLQAVREKVDVLARAPLPWSAVRVGHADCHSYLPTLVINGTIYPLIEDDNLFGDFIADFHSLSEARHLTLRARLKLYGAQVLLKPHWWLRGCRYVWWLLASTASDIFHARGRAHQLTFFIQNFMDAESLQQDRVDACSFTVMTADGPISMCQHNADRDDHILKPLDIELADGSIQHYEPLIWAEKQVAGASS